MSLKLSQKKTEYTHEINLYEKQSLAWKYLTEGKVDELGYGGGARGGKTILGAVWLIHMCVTFDDTRWVLARKTLKNLKITTLITFFKVAEILGYKGGVHYHYNQQTSVITWANKSEIILLDLVKDVNRDPLYLWLGGLEITGAWIDESNEVPARARDTLKSRCGNWNNSKYGIAPIMLETFNPSKNHIYRRYWKPWREGTLPENRRFIRALPSDNPHIEPGYIDGVMNTGDQVMIERLIRGNFDYDDDKLKLMRFDKIQDVFNNTFVEYDAEEGNRYLTCDVAGGGKDKTIIMYWEGWRGTVVHEESFTNQAMLEEKIIVLQRELHVPNSQTAVDYTGIGTGLGDRLNCFKFQSGSKAIGNRKNTEKGKGSISLEFANLRAQCFFYLSNMVNKNKIFLYNISKQDTDEIIEELAIVKQVDDSDGRPKRIIPKGSAYGSDGNKETMKSLLGRSPDKLDTIMMRAVFDLSHVSKSVSADILTDADMVDGFNFNLI